MSRSIVWDLGGTLMDTYPDVDRALARAAFGDDDGGARLAEVASLTRISSGHAITELARRTGVEEDALRAAYDGVKELWQRAPAPVMPGAREVIAAVTAGGGSTSWPPTVTVTAPRSSWRRPGSPSTTWCAHPMATTASRRQR